jgi:Icc-related predicted phosphoesterase
MLEILAVSDIENCELENTEHKKINLLLNCGDLKPGYLDYLLCEFKVSYGVMVLGNHDTVKQYPGMYILKQDIINLKKCINKDATIACFSGALAYGERPFYFQEKDVLRFKLKIGLKKLFGKQIDIILSHTPPNIQGICQNKIGYHKSSIKLGEVYKISRPSMWLYGHVHYQCLDVKINDSYVLNAVPFKFITYDEMEKKVMKVYPLHNQI